MGGGTANGTLRSPLLAVSRTLSWLRLSSAVSCRSDTGCTAIAKWRSSRLSCRMAAKPATKPAVRCSAWRLHVCSAVRRVRVWAAPGGRTQMGVCRLREASCVKGSKKATAPGVSCSADPSSKLVSPGSNSCNNTRTQERAVHWNVQAGRVRRNCIGSVPGWWVTRGLLRQQHRPPQRFCRSRSSQRSKHALQSPM